MGHHSPLLAPQLGVLLPLARFGGMAWLVAAAVLLPITRTPGNRTGEPADV